MDSAGHGKTEGRKDGCYIFYCGATSKLVLRSTSRTPIPHQQLEAGRGIK